jgi:hypothetical protein
MQFGPWCVGTRQFSAQAHRSPPGRVGKIYTRGNCYCNIYIRYPIPSSDPVSNRFGYALSAKQSAVWRDVTVRISYRILTTATTNTHRHTTAAGTGVERRSQTQLPDGTLDI